MSEALIACTILVGTIQDGKTSKGPGDTVDLSPEDAIRFAEIGLVSLPNEEAAAPVAAPLVNDPKGLVKGK